MKKFNLSSGPSCQFFWTCLKILGYNLEILAVELLSFSRLFPESMSRPNLASLATVFWLVVLRSELPEL